MGLDSAEVLVTPLVFDFPFTPYPIQHDFMKNLYETIENRRFGIFESPTGTGKSLSIICGALRWLKDHKENECKSLEDKIKDLEDRKQSLSSNSTDWLSSQSQEIEISHKLNLLKLEQSKLAEYEQKIQKLHIKKKPKHGIVLSVGKESDTTFNNAEEADEPLVEDEDMFLDDVATVPEEDSSDENTDDKYEPVKILICSRTHSQLSQLVGEIIKSPFGQHTRAISMASRQNYCINPVVSKLKNVSLINERCLDMQSKSSKSSKKTDECGKVIKRKKGSSTDCPYNKQQNVKDLSEISLLEIFDVEDLVAKAKQVKACPYYASRKAVEDAQVVLVPYNTLLHHTTREANGIKLKNNVVIIDEAHNLLEALAQMYSAEITYLQLQETHKRLKCYKQKFSTRFSSQNLLHINQLIFVIARLLNVLQDEKSVETKTDVYTVQDFVLTAKVDNYNMFRLIKFCRDTKIAQKLHNFSERYPEDIQTIDTKEKQRVRSGIQEFLSSIENKKVPAPVKQEVVSEDKLKSPLIFGNPFLAFINFMEALTYSYEDGRIITDTNRDKAHSRLRFLLLNPAAQFCEIAKSARAVIVAGGTMKPVTEFRGLFTNAGVTEDRIVEFSCDHIIPPHNILPLIITKGFNNENLLFNFENRFNMGNTIKVTLQELSKRVKGGIVVFFPSYKYEEWVWQQLKNVNFGERILFREPQDSASVDKVLESYAKVIRKPGSIGAMLFSVVGGKLSEGLNFSDDLGRCVVVIGLPYANINSPELKEKMKFLDNREGSGAGQRFYDALCMKSVNQCIGRAVRHSNDYACVVLLDQRYDRQSTKNALPNWIKRSLQVSIFKDALVSIEKFFIMHRKF